MKKFVALSPDLGGKSVRAFRTRDDAKTLMALRELAAPFDDEVAAELVALSLSPEPDLKKLAKKLLDKHAPAVAKAAAVFKGIGNRTHEFDARIRTLKAPWRLPFARAIAFHLWAGISVPFEEDPAFRAKILAEAVARAKREGEDTLLLGEIYQRWSGSGGRATTIDLHVFPDKLADELTALRKTYKFTGVSIHGGSLTDLPKSVAKMKPWLTKLSLDFNPLAEVPAVIFELTNLEELELAGTQISEIPASIKKLTKLRRLDIGNGDKMLKVPETVCALDQLRDLRIGNGKIKLIPEAIGGMTALETLELQSTSITRLPNAIATLPKLRKVAARFSRLHAEKARALLPKRVALEI